MEERRCGRCGEVKPFSEYYQVKGRPDSWCKKCRYEYSKKYAKRKYRDGIFYGHDGKLRVYNGSSGYGKVYWNENMLSILRRHYPNSHNDEICEMIGVSRRCLTAKAREMGLKKSESYLFNCRKRGGLTRKLHNKRGENGKFIKEAV